MQSVFSASARVRFSAADASDRSFFQETPQPRIPASRQVGIPSLFNALFFFSSRTYVSLKSFSPNPLVEVLILSGLRVSLSHGY